MVVLYMATLIIIESIRLTFYLRKAWRRRKIHRFIMKG